MSSQRPFFSFDAATVVSLAVVLLLARMSYVFWGTVHQVNMSELDQAWYSVLEGKPHWRAYQNRLLGPWVLQALGWVASQPFLLLVKLSMLALNAALFLMVRQQTGSALKGLFAVAIVLTLWALQTHYWSYPWDFIEAACLLALVQGALQGWSKRWLLALFVVALLNRESAVFFGVYMLAHGAALHWTQRSAQAKSWMLWGLGMIVLTLVWTEAMRHALFEYSSLAGINADEQHAVFGNHLNHAANWAALQEMLRNLQPLFFVVILYVLALVTLLSHALASRSPVLIGLGATMLAYFVSLMEFGFISESRLYQPLVWCLALLMVHVWGRSPQAPAGT